MKLSIAICVALLCFVSQGFADDSETGNDRSTPDTIFLKSGGELQGRFVSEIKDEDDGRKYVVFRTESGGLLKLDAGRLIKRVKLGDAIDAEYQRRLEVAANDPNLLWKVHQWCLDQKSGSVRFKNELRFLLRRIIELDPHDERARRKLGYRLVDDRWVLKDQLYTGHGYQRQGTTWVSELQSQLTEESNWRRRQEGDRKKALARWLKDSRKQNATRADLCDSWKNSAMQLPFLSSWRKQAR